MTKRTPFSDNTIHSLMLVIGIGGSSLSAAVLSY